MIDRYSKDRVKARPGRDYAKALARIHKTRVPFIVAALRCVDYVTVFSDESAEPILKALQPEVYVKGGDYTIDTIHQGERRLVEAYGGKIVIVPPVKGRSTSDIVARVVRGKKG